MTENKTILFVSLAMNQALFFDALGETLRIAGYTVAHTCFHEGAVRLLEERGRRVFNPYALQHGKKTSVSFEEFGIEQPGLLLGHEKAAYRINSTEALRQKFTGHLYAMGVIVDRLAEDAGRLVIVQELGGFSSVLAAFYAARRRSIDNWFIEPSFFRGRVCFTANTFTAPVVTQTGCMPTDGLNKILTHLTEANVVVVPEKDRSHYRGAVKKLMDAKNWSRLGQKIVSKHLRGDQEEFAHIGGHVVRHLRMALNSARLKRYYSDIPTQQSILYYPLHVPADFALTIRSPEYLDQYALIDFLCRTASLGAVVAIKEHPALIGAIDPARIRDLLRRHDNLMLLSPSLNNHQILKACQAVVTINSKAGAEALLYGKPVFALGDSFYKNASFITRILALGTLPSQMRSATDYSQEEVRSFFQDVWNASFPGELYTLTEENIETFAVSLQACLASNK